LLKQQLTERGPLKCRSCAGLEEHNLKMLLDMQVLKGQLEEKEAQLDFQDQSAQLELGRLRVELAAVVKARDELARCEGELVERCDVATLSEGKMHAEAAAARKGVAAEVEARVTEQMASASAAMMDKLEKMMEQMRDSLAKKDGELAVVREKNSEAHTEIEKLGAAGDALHEKMLSYKAQAAAELRLRADAKKQVGQLSQELQIQEQEMADQVRARTCDHGTP
jgi:chromosome segregation ATPase